MPKNIFIILIVLLTFSACNDLDCEDNNNFINLPPTGGEYNSHLVIHRITVWNEIFLIEYSEVFQKEVNFCITIDERIDYDRIYGELIDMDGNVCTQFEILQEPQPLEGVYCYNAYVDGNSWPNDIEFFRAWVLDENNGWNMRETEFHILDKAP